MGKGVRLVEVHVAERIRISAGVFCRSFHSHFIPELPLLRIILYVRPIHLANKGNQPQNDSQSKAYETDVDQHRQIKNLLKIGFKISWLVHVCYKSVV